MNAEFRSQAADKAGTGISAAASRRSAWSFRVALAVVLIAAGSFGARWVMAFVHDGKSAAIEAAVPMLEIVDNPYLLREAWWNDSFHNKGDVKIIKHQLFKRNDYWFWAGCSEPDAKVSIHVYDGLGELADDEDWQKENVAAVRIAPTASGNYYIRVELLENPSGESIDWAVIYAFR